MVTMLERQDYIRPILAALSLTLAAELFYLIVFGAILFPQGPFMSKLAWTFACGIGMGGVVAVLTILLVVGRVGDRAAFVASSSILFFVGSVCGVLCSRIDITMNYFGGEENTRLFLLASVIPAFVGGLLYGWLLYSASGRAIFARIEL